MSREVLLVVPEAPAPDNTAEIHERSIGTKPLRIGILDNTKSNADHLLALLLDGIGKEFEVASIVRTRKPHASLPAEPPIIDQLEQEADVVISAMAD
jgi:hypothetical protein